MTDIAHYIFIDENFLTHAPPAGILVDNFSVNFHAIYNSRYIGYIKCYISYAIEYMTVEKLSRS